MGDRPAPAHLREGPSDPVSRRLARPGFDWPLPKATGTWPTCRSGYPVKPDMPGLRGPEVERLYQRGAAWLAGEPVSPERVSGTRRRVAALIFPPGRKPLRAGARTRLGGRPYRAVARGGKVPSGWVDRISAHPGQVAGRGAQGAGLDEHVAEAGGPAGRRSRQAVPWSELADSDLADECSTLAPPGQRLRGEDSVPISPPDSSSSPKSTPQESMPKPDRGNRRAASSRPCRMSAYSRRMSQYSVPPAVTGRLGNLCTSCSETPEPLTCPAITRPPDAPRSTAATVALVIAGMRPAPPRRPG